MVMVSEDEKFNPASASREIFTQVVNRALNDMTDAQIEALVQSAVGTEMSQRQMADLNLQSALETAVSAIRSEMTHKASTSDVTAAVADEAAARQAADTTVYHSAAELVTDETAARQSADAELHDAVGAVAARGAKNLLKYDGCSASSTAGVSYTINADGTVTVNGTPQGSSPSYVQIMLNGNAVTVDKFCDGHHILSGCPAGGGDNKYRMYAAKGTYSRFDYGDGVLLTETALTDVRIVIYIANGYTANNLVFKPMIRPAEITDDTFAPYAPTNRELYEMILALHSGVSAQSSAASLMQSGRLDPAELTDTQEVTDDA